jgi:hypothetical protein
MSDTMPGSVPDSVPDDVSDPTPAPVGAATRRRRRADSDRVTDSADLADFAAEIADQVESFLVAVREVARGDAPETAVPMLLLEVSQLLLGGGRLGAIRDVVPDERFEPDAGPDEDLDELRERLAKLLEPVDSYMELFDPLAKPPELENRRVSDDLAMVVSDLAHGLAHYRASRVAEALWWWQFSYLSNWGPAASAAMRALLSVVARSRLEQPAMR